MARFLQERQAPSKRPNREETGERQEARPASTENGSREEVSGQRQPTLSDVDMESVGSCEYDPDDLELEETSARMANATMG